MSKDSRGADREPTPGGTPEATPPTPAAPEAAEEAQGFAAQTMNAERLSVEDASDFKDRWLRAEAELQNSRRRATRELTDGVRAAEDRILLEVIELLDDLERALAVLPPERAEDAWVQGVSLTAQRMRETLARRGVTPIAALGQPFDPASHEALLEVPAQAGVVPGTVAQEVLKGYQRGGRALRAARVVVARAEH